MIDNEFFNKPDEEELDAIFSAGLNMLIEAHTSPLFTLVISVTAQRHGDNFIQQATRDLQQYFIDHGYTNEQCVGIAAALLHIIVHAAAHAVSGTECKDRV